MFLGLAFLVFSALHSARCSPDVVELKGEANFRSIKLLWKAKDLPEEDFGFLITYCEDQAWGKYRCREKVIENGLDNAIRDRPASADTYDLFESTIDGLRLSTNYSVEVKPTIGGGVDPAQERARALDGSLFIQTKGFYARAIDCFANSSLVEIETGPFFGGKISVEGSTLPACSTEGDSSPRTSYLLSIDHALCGSQLQNTSVRTFILVQENLPILTHSTRRFMVVCSYVPETFTVRAGVNLPDYGDRLLPVGNDVSEVDPSELFDSTSAVFNSRTAKQIGGALKLAAKQAHKKEPQKWAHLVLMVVLIMSTVVGVSCAVVHFVRRARNADRNGFVSQDNEADIAAGVSRDPPSSEPPVAPSSSPAEASLTDPDLGTDNGTSATSTVQTDLAPCSLTLPFSTSEDTVTNVLVPTDPTDPTPDNCEPKATSVAMEPFVSLSPSMASMPSFIPGDHCLSVPLNNLENIDAVFEQSLSSSLTLNTPTFSTFTAPKPAEEGSSKGQLPPVSSFPGAPNPGPQDVDLGGCEGAKGDSGPKDFFVIDL